MGPKIELFVLKLKLLKYSFLSLRRTFSNLVKDTTN